jgi:carboxymethylenebutenolidase
MNPFWSQIAGELSPYMPGIGRRRVIAGVAAAGLLPVLAPSAAHAQQLYTEISYQSGGLRIQGYFYQPAGSGPFPTLIYNHGSRAGFERRSIPWVRLAALYVAAGYAVLVPERRGYGRSDGPAWSEAVGRDRGSVLIARLQAEADDVLAAIEYLRSVPSADINRLGIAGWSLGGIVTLFAISRSRSFRAAVDQAGGVLMWRFSPALQAALTQAARAVTCPILLMDAQNDAAPEAIPTLSQVMDAAGLPHRLIMYPPFTPTARQAAVAPGHLLFSAEGLPIWGGDAIGFFDAYLRR